MASSEERFPSIRTYLLVALIFAVLADLSFVLTEWFTVGRLIMVSTSTMPPTYQEGYRAYGGIAFEFIFFVLGIVVTSSVIVRTKRMLDRLNTGDIVGLKKLSSTGWAIAALVFSGVVPGIFLLVADGPIKSLDKKSPSK